MTATITSLKERSKTDFKSPKSSNRIELQLSQEMMKESKELLSGIKMLETNIQDSKSSNDEESEIEDDSSASDDKT